MQNYRYGASEPDADERGGSSDSDYDNSPAVMPDQNFMPDNPRNRLIPDPNSEDEKTKRAWLEENVYSKGWTVDGLTDEIYDPESDSVKGKVPTFYPRT
jgi:hypothetical protein